MCSIRRGGLSLLMALGWGTFSAWAEGPVIFKALDPVGPDETVLLFGDGIGPTAAAEGMRMADDPVSNPNGQAVHAPPDAEAVPLKLLQGTDRSAKVLIPADWKPGVYAVRLKRGGAASDWQFLNRPEIWWTLPEEGATAVPGEGLRIFGLNFGEHSRVWLEASGGPAREIPVTTARPYDLALTLPPDVAPGAYRVWVHNGFGGAAGFGEPADLVVTAPAPWPTQRFDVHQFGAKGDAKTDDTAAVNAALDAAQKAGGGVVWLPRGTYIITGKLTIPEKTILRGEKRELVWLKVPSKAPPIDSVVAGQGDFGVEDLSILSQTAKRLIVAPEGRGTYAQPRASWDEKTSAEGHVLLRSLRLQHLEFFHHLNKGDPRREIIQGQATVALRGPDCEISDCVIVAAGMPIELSDATRARILRNQLGTGRNGWYGIWDFQQGIFEGNEIVARDLEGSFGGVQRTAHCVMFRDNNWHDAYGCDRESLTFDTPYHPIWLGPVTMSGPTDMALGASQGGAGWPVGNDSRCVALVVAGKGLGQMVQVTAHTADDVTLAAPWKIPPDDTSVVAISIDKSRVLVIDNHASDSSVAVQLYAQSYEFVVAGNHAERTGGSYANGWHAIDKQGHLRFSFAYFNQWLDNDFDQGLVYEEGPSLTGFLGINIGRAANMPFAVSGIGNRFERNRLDANTQLGAMTTGTPMPDGSAINLDAIFENNAWPDLNSKLFVNKGNAFTLLRHNGRADAPPPLEDKGDQTVTVAPGK